ncbi:RagB/SusD family nutrient uptake outer membrane protein [Mariniflexile sp. AS56]|uniref:RagB/SusD family nutrient uptake outer membrane protein n=1 Tax=Mariniflexile sp. AS56 TaxID=3063957 RepID=UPI0026EFF54E|nr:RagB/SusD family nutrient uptake outer membrane protein [Mariniflexile sp. AS56]MDO7172658.1 RagB/SusD family nutrient uptake outer membrane protein [Mariniflexile sp. AS56]
MKYIKTYKRTLLLALLVTFVSCNDFLEVEDLDQLDLSTVYQTEEDLKLALNNLYFTLPILDLEDNLNNEEPDQAYLVPYFWTDDAVHRNINGAGTNASEFIWAASTRALRSFYRYPDIASINFFLEALPGAEFETESNRTRFAAEARFFRAWIYESMLFAYGDVPLLTNTITPTDAPSRTPRQEVFNFVISELDAIDKELPESYDSENMGRITKGAVLALKARAYLNAIGWSSDKNAMYGGAEAACEEIINSGVYSLVNGIAGFEAQFTSASDLVSPETILANIYTPLIKTHRYARQIGLQGTWRGSAGTLTNQRRPGYTSDFIEEVQTINGLFPKDDPTYNPADPWSNRDPRLRVSVVLPGDQLPGTSSGSVFTFQPHPNIAPTTDDIGGVNNPTGYGFKKYLDYTLSILNEGDVDLKLIRYSEVLLMYAEALAGQGRDSEALPYLDAVRERVGMPEYGTIGLPTVTRGTTGNQLIDAILLERRYEFAGEGPQRWFDIWRYKLGDQVIKPVYGIPESIPLPGDLVGPKYNAARSTLFEREWNERNYLLPIWQNYLDANPNLSPNNPDW